MPHSPELSWQSMEVETVGPTKALVSWDVAKAKALLKRMHQAQYSERLCFLELVLGKKSTSVLKEVAVYESCKTCLIHGKAASPKQVQQNKIVYIELDALNNMPSLCKIAGEHRQFQHDKFAAKPDRTTHRQRASQRLGLQRCQD